MLTRPTPAHEAMVVVAVVVASPEVVAEDAAVAVEAIMDVEGEFLMTTALQSLKNAMVSTPRIYSVHSGTMNGPHLDVNGSTKFVTAVRQQRPATEITAGTANAQPVSRTLTIANETAITELTPNRVKRLRIRPHRRILKVRKAAKPA